MPGQRCQVSDAGRVGGLGAVLRCAIGIAQALGPRGRWIHHALTRPLSTYVHKWTRPYTQRTYTLGPPTADAAAGGLRPSAELGRLAASV